MAAVLVYSAQSARAQGSIPPPVTVTQSSAAAADGLIFLTPSPLKPVSAGEVSSIGPEIVDSQGRPVWFHPLPAGTIAGDFRVQTYHGKPVLTWAQGAGFQITVPGSNTNYICDTAYNVIATVQAGNGLNADEHEFQLTPQDTALITVYNNVPTDLSALGGSATGVVQEGVVQEIDVATGAVLLEWHSLGHVPISESYVPVPATGTYDYFHINSVSLDTDGNLLISSRHTWTIYKVNRQTGEIMWRLGGKFSDFAMDSGLSFAWQHNAVAVNATTIRIFDNESSGTAVLPASRVLWIHHDDTTMTASLASSPVQHPAGLSALAEGSAQALSNGDTFVGWGILGRFSEFNPNGALLVDAALPPGYNCYRSFRMPWTAAPATSPTVTAQYNGDGTTTVHAVWNGATQVASWSILSGESAGSLAVAGSVAWNGLDTSSVIPGQSPTVKVVAYDSTGATLGSSDPVGIPPTFAAPPASQTVATGSTVVFGVTAYGPNPAYQWTLNGSPLSDGAALGATYSGTSGPVLVISGANPATAGNYACVATGPAGASTSVPATLTVVDTADPGRLTNVSARARVGTGANVLIAGYVVGGQQASGTQDLLVRASGPSLASFSVPNILPDPELVLSFISPMRTSSKTVSAWNGSPVIAQAAAAVGAFAWENAASLDSALVQHFHMGTNTAEVLGASGDTGVALAEVYDATPPGTYTPSTPHLVNVSARAVVGTGSDVLIAGFVIGGQTAKTVLIRASGPALAGFGIPGSLKDPKVALYGGDTTSSPLASNSGWAGDPAVASAARAVGAFGWTDAQSNDSALLVTLSPGAYTAEVLGQSGVTGVALVEVYEIP